MNDDTMQISRQYSIPDGLFLGIIAGGRSTRWSDKMSKCLSEFHGQTMTENLLSTTSLPIGGICIRPEQYNTWVQYSLPYPILQENRPDLPEGPLKGIYCLLSSLTINQFMLIAPCDMPLLNDQILSLLWQKQQELQTIRPILLTNVMGKHTPVCLLSAQLLPSLENYLLSGQQKLIRWLEQESAHTVTWLGDQTLLVNLNSITDLNQLNTSK